VLKKKTKQAKKCISEAMKLFEQNEMATYLKQTKDALATLG
jgi:hypothetical protein